MSKTVAQKESTRGFDFGQKTWSAHPRRKDREVWYLFLGNAHVICNVGEDGGLNEEALPAQAFPTTFQSCTFSDTALNKFQDLVVLLLINLKGEEREGVVSDSPGITKSLTMDVKHELQLEFVAPINYSPSTFQTTLYNSFVLTFPDRYLVLFTQYYWPAHFSLSFFSFQI